MGGKGATNKRNEQLVQNCKESKKISCKNNKINK